MFRNYIRVAWRNIVKNRFYSVINILGLSMGIAFTLLIGAYVWQELQVNRNLRNAGNQYTIQSKWKDPNMGFALGTFGPLAKALKEQYPGLVANYYRWDGITSNVSRGNNIFREGLQVGDSTLLHMYGFALLHGDPGSAFKDPFSVVITEDRAIKYFGKTDVVGQTVTIESFSGSRHDFMVTGVMKTPDDNSVTHINSDNENNFFIPESCLGFFGRDMNPWANTQIAGLLELKDGVKPEDIQGPMQRLIKANALPQVSENITPYLVPLKEYYLKKDNGLVRKMLYTVSFIALFILLMAVINFINVSISRSTARIREIGLRKVLGGMRRQLIQQFLIEAIVLVFLATIVALGIYWIANPYLSGVLGKQIPRLSDFSYTFFLVPLVLIMIVGVLAGIYPALVLSALRAADSIKGKLRSVRENIFLRKSLVGFQFCTASIVLIGAIIISKQVSFFFSRDLGYDKDFMLSAQVPRDWSAAGVQRFEAVKNEFASMPEVKDVSLSFEIPNGANAGSFPVYVEGKDSTQWVMSQSLTTDERYADTYQIPLKAGSFFSRPFMPADTLKVVINETEAKALGWNDPGEAIGKRLKVPGGGMPLTVTGVARDFHFGSMQQNIQPMIFVHVKLGKIYRYLSFKLRPGNIGGSIAALQKKWSVLLPGTSFEYNFMDSNLEKLYQSEIQLKKAAHTATMLALVIVTLGIIGLISLSIQKRTKEIGIRKVLGASGASIVSLFLKEFLPVILIGGAVSIPIAYYIMKNWLNDYAYRIEVTSAPFLISIILLGMIVSLLITVQIAKAARENPVKNLRIE